MGEGKDAVERLSIFSPSLILEPYADSTGEIMPRQWELSKGGSQRHRPALQTGAADESSQSDTRRDYEVRVNLKSRCFRVACHTPTTVPQVPHSL